MSDRPKLEARRQARAQPGLDCRKVVWRCTGELEPSGWGSILQSAQRELRARKSSDSRVLVSCVGCRGRQEASSPCHRGEPRGKPRSVRSSAGRPFVSTGRTGTLRAKGCEDFRANVTGNAKGFARSRGRDRTGGRHPGLRYGVASNRAASFRVLATWDAEILTKDGRSAANAGLRRSRESAHGATEGVRGYDVRFGPPSRRAQGVCSQRERSTGQPRMRGSSRRDDSRTAPDDPS